MNPYSIQSLVRLALAEDVGPGDLTTALTVPDDIQGRARIITRKPVVISGTTVAVETAAQTDPRLKITLKAEDGTFLAENDEILVIEGPACSILTAERVMLNFMMRLSGVATITKAFVDQVKGTKARLVDTRKTTPGLRLLEKAAVRHGGGHNHRFALYDGILIKDNHIAAAGSITQAVSRARLGAAHTLKIEVEVTDLKQLEEALTAGADLILLDNMNLDLLRSSVSFADSFFKPAPKKVLLEASGGVNLATVKSIAETGVDLISVGALTHSAPAADFSLQWL